jgi:hypothetical protein
MLDRIRSRVPARLSGELTGGSHLDMSGCSAGSLITTGGHGVRRGEAEISSEGGRADEIDRELSGLVFVSGGHGLVVLRVHVVPQQTRSVTHTRISRRSHLGNHVSLPIELRAENHKLLFETCLFRAWEVRLTGGTSTGVSSRSQ